MFALSQQVVLFVFKFAFIGKKGTTSKEKQQQKIQNFPPLPAKVDLTDTRQDEILRGNILARGTVERGAFRYVPLAAS